MHDMGPFPLNEGTAFENLVLYRHAADAGRLPVRVLAMVPHFSWQATHAGRLSSIVSSAAVPALLIPATYALRLQACRTLAADSMPRHAA